MAGQLYSVNIAAASFPAGQTAIGGPPNGYRWVIRSFACAWPATAGPTVGIICNPQGLYILRLQGPSTIPYAYMDCRVVVPDGSTLTVDRGTTQGGVILSGYQLALP